MANNLGLDPFPDPIGILGPAVSHFGFWQEECAQHLDIPKIAMVPKGGSDCVNGSRILSWSLLATEFNPSWYQWLQIIVQE